MNVPVVLRPAGSPGRRAVFGAVCATRIAWTREQRISIAASNPAATRWLSDRSMDSREGAVTETMATKKAIVARAIYQAIRPFVHFQHYLWFPKVAKVLRDAYRQAKNGAFVQGVREHRKECEHPDSKPNRQSLVHLRGRRFLIALRAQDEAGTTSRASPIRPSADSDNVISNSDCHLVA